MIEALEVHKKNPKDVSNNLISVREQNKELELRIKY